MISFIYFSIEHLVMFVNTAFVIPTTGKENEIADVMNNFAKALQGSEGLIRVHVLKEKGGNALVGISMWENEENFNRAMARLAPSPASRSKDEAIHETPTVVRQFIEI